MQEAFLGLLRWRDRTKQSAAGGKILAFGAIGHQPIVADPRQTLGENVEQEATQELHPADHFYFTPISVCAISIRESNLVTVDAKNSVV